MIGSRFVSAATPRNGLGVGYTPRPVCGHRTLPVGTAYGGKVPTRSSFRLIGFALSATAKQTLGKAVLLLLVEARVQRLGRVGEFLSVVGTLDLTIGVLSQFIE